MAGEKEENKEEEIYYDEAENYLLINCPHCQNRERWHFDFGALSDDGKQEYLCPKCNGISLIVAKMFIYKLPKPKHKFVERRE